MSHRSLFLVRLGIICGAMFYTAASFAEQKPIALEVVPAASSVAAQSTITKPGSYVLTRNITNNSSKGANSVLIKSSNVTIDLQGFVISATGSATGGGILIDPQAPSPITNVVIRNGIITGFQGAGVSAGTGARISGLNVTNNGSGISCGTGCVVRDNVIQGNAGAGIIFSDATGGYLGNILQGNNGGGAQVVNGTSLQQNLCNGTPC